MTTRTQQAILAEIAARIATDKRRLHQRTIELLTAKQICWLRGKKAQQGTVKAVIGLPGRTRLLVENEQTGRQYRIGLEDYLAADQD